MEGSGNEQIMNVKVMSCKTTNSNVGLVVPAHASSASDADLL